MRDVSEGQQMDVSYGKGTLPELGRAGVGPLKAAAADSKGKLGPLKAEAAVPVHSHGTPFLFAVSSGR